MGHRELLEKLRREGDDQAESFRRAAELEATELRAAAADRLRELEAAYDLRCRQLCEGNRRDIMAEAEHTAALTCLRAEARLAARLRQRAAAQLPALRIRLGADLLGKLAAELPEEEWREVRVHPDDVAMAAHRFPGAAVSPDSTISGGLVAVSGDGTLEVVNTLETRLERAWPDLLPQIMDDVRRERP